MGKDSSASIRIRIEKGENGSESYFMEDLEDSPSFKSAEEVQELFKKTVLSLFLTELIMINLL